ncbi:hypothetical protein PF010_g14722 [Phytophthora fragariae]|uniref:Uncharacterized protein n=1 Tax=Phytophthora fragariae TaxID=53985 RepID=A0A6G0KX17_9STRA|nr:hypothetical protein PF010_g14722 [Phytophthora fragariae]
MPHVIAQAQSAIRAVRAAFGFDSSRPGDITSVVAPMPLDEPSPGSTPADDTPPAGAVDSAPSSGSASPSEAASTEVLSSPVATPSSSAGVPSSPTSVPASAHGVSIEPQAAGVVDTSDESASTSEVPVLEAASGHAGRSSPTPAEPSAGGASSGPATLQPPSSPRQRCPSPVSPPGSQCDPSGFCRTNSCYAVPAVEPVPPARASASLYACSGRV